jgi:S-adenosylmethionine:tRNA ribosyltransferase-isomerase
VRTDEFDYDLPPVRIAQHPLAARDASRLLVDAGDGTVRHRHTRVLPELVRPGDVLVLNDTRVLPARVRFTRPTGGAGEVLLLEPQADGWWHALVRPSRKLAPGTVITIGADLRFELGADAGAGRRLVRPDTTDLAAALDRHGEMPLPPYIEERLADAERYQTVYADRPASAAAPTAGLHLTPDVLARCAAAGARIATVELVVGLDTFRPITTADVAQHQMHTERYRVPADTWAACAAAERVVAVGTTVVRALESVAAGRGLEGRTDLFIQRPYEFRVVDALLTNFHLPRSSLLVLVDAFVGPRWRELYAIARAEHYRFLSFGDAMFLSAGRPTSRTAR